MASCKVSGDARHHKGGRLPYVLREWMGKNERKRNEGEAVEVSKETKDGREMGGGGLAVAYMHPQTPQTDGSLPSTARGFAHA